MDLLTKDSLPKQQSAIVYIVVLVRPCSFIALDITDFNMVSIIGMRN